MTLHRSCSAALVFVERKNELWQGLFFLFLYSVTDRLYGKETERSNKTEKNVRYKTARWDMRYIGNVEFILR